MAAAQQTFYNPPWPSPLYQRLHVLVNHYTDADFNLQESIFSQPIFELLSKTAGIIFNPQHEREVNNDKELAFGLGKDILQTSEGIYEIVLNGTLGFRYTFDPKNTFSHTYDGLQSKEELEKYVEAHKDRPSSELDQAKKDLEQIEIKPPELQAIEQLYTFLTGHSCTINSEHFLFILLGIQQSNVTEIMERIKDEILNKFPTDFLYLQYVTPFINKIVFDIRCDQLSRRLEIRTRVKYHLSIMTDQGNKQILFPFQLTDIVYDLDLTNIENEDKPGLKLQATPVQELFKLYRDFYNILKNVPNVIKTSTGEINYSVFSAALQQKIKYRTEGRGQAVEERMALKGFMGGRQQKKSPRIRRVSKKRFKRSRRQRNQRKSKQNK